MHRLADVSSCEPPNWRGSAVRIPNTAKIAVHEGDAARRPAHLAVPALGAIRKTEEHVVTRLDAGDGRADLDDLTGAFVSDDAREWGREDAGLNDEVRMAQTAGCHPDEDLCVLRRPGSAVVSSPTRVAERPTVRLRVVDLDIAQLKGRVELSQYQRLCLQHVSWKGASLRSQAALRFR